MKNNKPNTFAPFTSDSICVCLCVSEFDYIFASIFLTRHVVRSTFNKDSHIKSAMFVVNRNRIDVVVDEVHFVKIHRVTLLQPRHQCQCIGNMICYTAVRIEIAREAIPEMIHSPRESLCMYGYNII